jgi:UDP:flavonoid glycosyltransferase YjiC (YdhE family)
VPGLALAGRSDLLIHHGGYGSCQTGLYTGTPALAIPTFFECESNARRMAAVGAGDFVPPVNHEQGRNKHVHAEAVRQKVDLILSQPAYRENAECISAKMRTFGGAAHAAG